MTSPDNCKEILVSKSRIDKAGVDIVQSFNDTKANEVVECYRLSHLSNMGNCIEMVAAAELPKHALFSARLKSLARIRRKIENSMLRNNATRLSRMDDIIGIRVICDSCHEANLFSDRLEGKHNNQVKNYVEQPQETGYRAVHHIIKVGNILPNDPDRSFTFEVQIRTVYQHLWALWSESFGEQAKENRLRHQVSDHLIKLSNIIQNWENKHSKTKQDNNLPAISHEYNIVVVKKSSVGKPHQFPFPMIDWSKAYEMLSYWETPTGNPDAILLLADAETHAEKTLKKTHFNYYADVSVPARIRTNDELRFEYK